MISFTMLSFYLCVCVSQDEAKTPSTNTNIYDLLILWETVTVQRRPFD